MYLEGKLKIYQDSDTMQEGEDSQSLQIELLDGGGGVFLRLSTGSRGWAVDSVADLVKQLQPIEKMARELGRIKDGPEKVVTNG